MKRLTSILVVIAALFISCNKTQICDNAQASANGLALVIATRWSCNQDKVYADLVKPINDTICTMKVEKAGWHQAVCNVAIKFFMNWGANKIANRWTCDKAKVQADLSNTNKLCSLL